MEDFIEISDSPLSGFKRKVQWTDLLISKNEKEFRLYTVCRFYESIETVSGITYGNEISKLEIKPFERILYAKNSNMVNPNTGLLTTKNFSGGTEVWIDVLGNVSLSAMGQYDYFFNRLKESEIFLDVINSIIHSEDLIYKTYDK